MLNSTFKALLSVVMVFPVLASAGDSLLPNIPKANGEQCVAPSQEMRVHHMDYILHQRDETMHKGIRTKQYSLKECIKCHVVAKEDGSYPSVKSNEHFCATCHQYTAVSIDCFQCHTDKPESASGMATSSEVNPHGH